MFTVTSLPLTAVGWVGSDEGNDIGREVWRPAMSSQAKVFPDLVVVRHDASPESNPEPGLRRKVMAYNDKLFLVEHRMVKGWKGTVHSHPHDQMVYVVGGRLKVTSDGKIFEIQTGDSFVVRGGVEHGAVALEDSLVVDIFTPCREDYIK
jgi:unsaturated pyranuronate lyase